MRTFFRKCAACAVWQLASFVHCFCCLIEACTELLVKCRLMRVSWHRCCYAVKLLTWGSALCVVLGLSCSLSMEGLTLYTARTS